MKHIFCSFCFNFHIYLFNFYEQTSSPIIRVPRNVNWNSKMQSCNSTTKINNIINVCFLFLTCQNESNKKCILFCCNKSISISFVKKFPFELINVLIVLDLSLYEILLYKLFLFIKILNNSQTFHC